MWPEGRPHTMSQSFLLNRKARKGRKDTSRIQTFDGESLGCRGRKISLLMLFWIEENWRDFAILAILAVKYSE